MISFSRNSRSIIANWWWTVDKVLLTLVTVIILIGIFLNFSASPAVANRIGVGSFHFIKRQLLFLPVAYMLMVFLSMQNLKTIRRVAILGYTVTILLMIATLFWGEETKGASRWIHILGFSLQPSEFIKPCFAVVAAWLFDGQQKYRDFPGNILSTCLFAFTLILLLLQPDVGMSIVVSVIWLFQFFLAGLGTLSFAILFACPRRCLPYCALVGAVGWLWYELLTLLGADAATASLLAVIPLTILTRVFAITQKTPVTVFLLTGIFPLVPGAGIYYTAYYFIQNENALALAKGISTFKIAVALAIGISLVLCVPLPKRK